MSIWSNIVRGVALGDAWGAPNEFRRIEDLTKHSPQGPGMPKFLEITDDTQMTLYLAAALDDTWGGSEDEIKAAILENYLAYNIDPDNNRAPGVTVTGSLGQLRSLGGKNWQRATSKTSDGCGTVMRATPTAFLPEDIWVGATAFGAAVTHGTPNGVAAAILNVAVLREIIQGEIKPGELTRRALVLADNAEQNGLLDVGTWLDGFEFTENRTLVMGFEELARLLKNALQELPNLTARPWNLNSDASTVAGMKGGWRAHEALVISLLCVDMLPGKPYLALRRSVTSDGDSDTLGAVAGGLIGACYPTCFIDVWKRDDGDGKTIRDRFEPRYIRWIEMEADDYPFDLAPKGWLRKLVGLVK